LIALPIHAPRAAGLLEIIEQTKTVLSRRREALLLEVGADAGHVVLHRSALGTSGRHDRSETFAHGPSPRLDSA
jgi:hypothetical protein